MMFQSLLALSAALVLANSALAADNGSTLAVVIFHNACDRTSTIASPDQNELSADQLTANGAQNCFASGQWYGTHYLSEVSFHKIYELSDVYDPNLVQAMVPSENLYIQSGTAFLQGMFPPIAELIDYNGTIQTPLNGYQYAVLQTYSPDDPSSIWVNGSAQCPNQLASRNTYFASLDFLEVLNETESFFQSLYTPYLQGVFDYNDVNFAKADAIYDYLSLNYAGNATLASLPLEDLSRLRDYATTLLFNEYSDLGISGRPSWEELDVNGTAIRDIGARAMARKVLGSLEINIDGNNEINKLNFMLGDIDTFISFFAIANLTSISANFMGLPAFGASMAFELMTTNETNETNFDTLTDDLFVRFAFRNGTDAPIDYYPLFESTNEIMLPWETFSTQMNAIAVKQVDEWCTLCASEASFCTQEIFQNITYIEATPTATGISTKQAVSPTVAGVIGAIVTLAVVGILSVSAFCCFGIALTRHQRRRSSMLSGLGRSQKPEKVGSDMELALSPRASAMGQSQVDHYDDIGGKFDTMSSTATAVAVQRPTDVHLKEYDL